jgi:hypothetical protein
MNYEVNTCIEVTGLENEWAVTLERCKEEMKPVIPKFITVCNEVTPDKIFVDNTLVDDIPEKIIDGVNGGICDNYIQVGFWKLKE